MNGLRKRAHFQRQDLWKADYSKFDNVVIFGVEEMVHQLSYGVQFSIIAVDKVFAQYVPSINVTA